MRGLLLTILLVIAGASFAQDPVISLNIVTKDDDTGKKLAGATVVVKSGGSVFVTKTAASNGKVPPIDLPLGQNYVVYIKKEGYVTKVANIDGHYDYPEDLPPFVPFPIQTSLFKKVDGVDFKWLETTPMIKFELDQYGNQTWDQAYTKDMLKKIEELKKKLAEAADEEAQKREDFDKFVAAGDKAMGDPNYEEAIKNYESALALFDEADVKKKLDDAKKKLEEQNKNAELEAAFQEKMKQAKDAYTAKKYEEALGLYKEASGMKPNEKLPKDRITEIEGILKDLKDQEAKFDKFVKDGDNAVGAEDFDNAISNYESALGIKDDAAVQKKLEDAKAAKKAKEDADAEAKELEKKYNDLITEADKLFTSKTYEESKAKYQEALGLKPNESHPAARISEIDEILKKLQEDADAAAKLEEDYKKAIEAGDAAFASRKWDDAIAQYEKALGLKSGEKHPTDQIALAKKNKEDDANQAAQDEKYQKLMDEGKGLKDGEKYEDAIAKYKEASGIKPNEQEPKDRIAELEKIIAELADANAKEEKYKKLMEEGETFQGKTELEAALGKYEEALSTKPGDGPAQTKIDEVKKLIADRDAEADKEAKFAEYVAAGAKDFGNKSYESAKKNYQSALDIKDDADVKARIAEIDEIMKKNADAAELEAKYEAAIQAADKAYAADELEDAKAKYEEALTYMDEQHPKDRIAKINEKLAELADANAKEQQFKDLVKEGDDLAGQMEYDKAIAKYNEAIKIKPDQSISQRILDLKAKQKEEEANQELIAKYKAKIAEADAAFDAQNWDGAKALYADAIDIKGDETYPKDQLAEIERLMKEQSENEVEAQYQKIITKADGLRDEEKFEDAISYYERAKNIKASDPYPKEQIDKINELIEQRKKEEADKEALEKQYKDLIALADADFTAKSYEDALTKYQEALALKPKATHPKTRIAEIKKILAKKESDSALETKYKEALEKADKLFSTENYVEAKPAYQAALDIIPTKKYPKDQIALCKQKMKEQSENEVEEQYQKILTAAQNKLDEKEYQKAIDYYNRALGIRPSDPFPASQIEKIEKILADQDAEAAKEEKYNAAIKKADGLFAAENYVEAKKVYEKAYNIKNRQYPQDRIALCVEKMKEKSGSEEEEQYQKILTVAKKKFDEKNYEKALELYKRAKGIRPSDPIPQQRIDEINQLLNEMADKKAKRDRFNKLIMQADTHFERKEWKLALDVYREALGIFDEQYPNDQVAKCVKFLKSIDTPNQQYDKLIAKADEYFDAANYEKAKGLYKRAINIKPSDQYPKDRLAEINKILNPPPKIAGVDGQLTDYGPPVNETPIDIEAMLIEAREQDREFEVQKIYQQRDDARDAIQGWEVTNDDNSHKTRDQAEDIELNLRELRWAGDEGRKEARDQVDIWQLQVQDEINEYTRIQENDIQFQNKKVEAMQIDIAENQMDNDVPREEYLLDVEKIKIENNETIDYYATDQKDVNYRDEAEINNIIESHVTKDPNNDVARLNSEVEVEDMYIVNFNRSNEDAWDQEDQVMHTKNESDLLVEDIIANKLGSDLPREENLVIVEEINLSYQDRENKNHATQLDYTMDTRDQSEQMTIDIAENNLDSDNPRQDTELIVEETIVSLQERELKDQNKQYDQTIDTKNFSEEMVIEIQENNMDNDDPRQKTEVLVEDKYIEYTETTTEFQTSQTDVVMNNDEKLEKIETDIQKKNLTLDKNRVDYEEKIVEVKEDQFDYSTELSTNNEDNSHDTKDHTELMNEQQKDLNKINSDKAIDQADKTDDAIENHILHVSDNAKENQESLEDGEDYIETLKDINVHEITPELENELGKKYPEGVTEESFAINDSNGLLKAYVVRRIVVTNGNGKVYEKTQTRYGAVTYTRNGQPISEYQYSDETSSANTARN